MSWEIEGWNVSAAKESHICTRAVKDCAIKTIEKNTRECFAQAARLNRLCPDVSEGERWHIVTEKSMNAYAFILQQLEKGIVDELYLAIYRINEPTVFSLLQLIQQRRIKNATFITSNFFRENKKAEKWATALKIGCDELDNARVAFVHSHCKIALINRGGGGQKFVFQGSGNLSDNARIEQYTYEQNGEVFDFHKKWMDSLFE